MAVTKQSHLRYDVAVGKTKQAKIDIPALAIKVPVAFFAYLRVDKCLMHRRIDSEALAKAVIEIADQPQHDK